MGIYDFFIELPMYDVLRVDSIRVFYLTDLLVISYKTQQSIFDVRIIAQN
jgi:hypothetical protein